MAENDGKIRAGAMVLLPPGMTPADLVLSVGFTDEQLHQLPAAMGGAGGPRGLVSVVQHDGLEASWNPNSFSVDNAASPAVVLFSAMGGQPPQGAFATPYNIAVTQGGTVIVSLDDRRRPHSLKGEPAVVYSTGVKEFAWHGVRVPEFVITKPEQITPDVIEAETNTEVRRVMVEVYGAQRYMQDCGAIMINRDECGELYRKKPTFEGEEELWFVKVKNATAESNGTFKEYFLRVPPSVRINEPGIWRGAVRLRPFKTARDAIAWTFSISPKDYRPIVQS